MISLTRPAVSCVAIAVAFGVVASADAPHIYAIRGARLVTAVGAPIASGTIVIRNGLIDAVGAGVQPPADAMVIDGTSMTVYPGLIDLGNTAGLDVQVPLNQPDTLRTTEDAERWKRSVIFRPELEAADHMRPDAPELSRLVSTGVTTVLATPPGVIVKGQSALVNVAAPADEPQIGSVAAPRRGLQIVRTPVALHVQFADNVRGDGYPVSLLGAIAFVRQSFLDAQHQQLEEQRYDRLKTGVSRPVYDKSLDALQPALAGRLPVAFEAGLAREIRRALAMAQEFKLDPIITGGHESDQVATELKARNARVIYSLNFPARGSCPPRPMSRFASCACARRPRRLRRRSRKPACRSHSPRRAFASRGTS
jgi:hypothetical protein